MKQTNKTLALLGLALALLGACSADDERSLSEVVTRADSAPVYLYVEDMDGHNLVDATQSVRAWAAATGDPLSCDIVHPQQPTSWGGSGSLIAVTPATPFHDPKDPEYTYTLNPTTIVAVGNLEVPLTRLYDYQLRRYTPTGGGQGVDASFTTAETRVCGGALRGDTAHIIVESGYPNLRVEGDELTVELRFPAVSDSLAALPMEKNEEDEWTNGWLQFQLSHNGRVIARPYETVSAANASDEATGDSWFALRIRMRLPYIIQDVYQLLMQFQYDFLVQSELLFGDTYQHLFSIYCWDWELTGEVHLESVFNDTQSVENPQFATTHPYSIIIDYRNNHHQEEP